MLVSVVIPVFNQAQYLRQAIESAWNQDLTDMPDPVDLEVIIVDDMSTDESLAIAKEYWQREQNKFIQERDKIVNWHRAHSMSEEDITKAVQHIRNRIIIVEQPQNMGLPFARNAGINATYSRNGHDLILPLDADDWIKPNYLKKTVPLMKDRVGVVGTWAACFGIKEYTWHTNTPTISQLMKDNCVPVCSLIRRGAFDETKGYSTDLRCGYEDWNMWIDMLERGWKIQILPEALFHYREKPNSMLKEATKKREGLIGQIHRMHPNLWLPTGEVNPVFASAQKRLQESGGRHAEIVDKIHKSYPSFCLPIGRVADARAYVGNDAVSGYLQCEILKKEGCMPESMVLDIGCGALYAGFFLANYLNEAHFMGMEPNKWLVDAALEQECVRNVMQEKLARFSFRDDFDATVWETNFDFILSHSILSHAAHWQLDQFLKNTSKVLNTDGKIVASLRLAEGNNLGNSGTVDKKDSRDEYWLYPGNSFFTLDTVVQTAAKYNLKAELRVEFTELLTSVNYGEFHDWFVFTRSAQ